MRTAVMIGSQPWSQKRLPEREQLEEKKMIKLGKKTTAILLTAIIILSMTPILANAPQISQCFYGDVTINGSPAPWLTLVEAKIAGVTRDSELTAENAYGYGGTFWVDAVLGDVIDFYVNGVLARSYQYVAFDPELIKVDLSIPVGTLSIDTNPVKGEVLVDGAPWGVAPQSDIVAVGTYTVSFGDVAGYTTPIDQEVVVTDGATTEVLGTYVLIQPSSLYPVTVTLSTCETVYIASHTSDLEDGNWIELSGGTEIAIPDLTLAYEGPPSAVYESPAGVTVSISSLFSEGSAAYPLDTHQVYSTSQSISVKFWGASALKGTEVYFRLIKISSLAEAREIAVDTYNGDLSTLRSKLNGAILSIQKQLDGAGDATLTIPSKGVGNYLLLVTKENSSPYELYVYSATVIEVLEKSLVVTCPSSVEKGDKLNLDTGAGAISAAVLIKKSAYTGEVKLVSEGTVLSTEIYLNDVKMADGSLANKPLTIDTALELLDTFDTAFGSNEMAMSVNLFGGSLSIPTSSLATGDYVLLAGVVKLDPVRIAGVYQKTVTVNPKYVPTPGAANKPPVADAGPNQKAWVDKTVYFDASYSKDPDGSIISYSWSFGDGAKAIGKTISHKYSKIGKYTVTLTVKDNRGAEDSDTCTVTVSEPPAPVSKEFIEQVPGGVTRHIVDAMEAANTTVTLNTTKPVTVTVLKYEGNPHPEDPMPEYALPIYLDIEVSNSTAVIWPIYVEVHYTDEMVEGMDEEALGLYYWKDGAWHRCSDTGVDTERNIVWAYMTEEEAAGSPILVGYTPPKPAMFILSDLTITPAEVEPGEEVTISVLVTNIGEEKGGYTVTLNITLEDTPLVFKQYHTIEGGESKTAEFKFTTDAEGTYRVEVDGLTGSFIVKSLPTPFKPAEFKVSDLKVSPTEVEEGESVTVSVTITNVGEMMGTHTLDILIDGERLEGPPIETTLIGGASETVTLTVIEELGSHTVKVDGLLELFTVTTPPGPVLSLWVIIVILILIIAVGVYIYLRYMSPYKQ